VVLNHKKFCEVLPNVDKVTDFFQKRLAHPYGKKLTKFAKEYVVIIKNYYKNPNTYIFPENLVPDVDMPPSQNHPDKFLVGEPSNEVSLSGNKPFGVFPPDKSKT